MIQDCYIEEIKDIVKEKKLHMSEQELYFAEREMQKNIIEYNMKIYLCKGYAFLYIQTSHILFTDESMQKKGAIKNTAHQIIIYGGNIYE